MVTTSVTEPKSGTMTEGEGRKSPLTDAKTPADGKVSSGTPKTYTEAELKAAVKAAEGRAAKEVATYKAQAEESKQEAERAVSDTEEEITSLKADLATAFEDNPSEVTTILKELNAKKAQLKLDVAAELKAAKEIKRAAETEREAHAAEVAEAQVTKAEKQAAEYEVALIEVAETYEGGDSTRLKSLCEDRIEATGKPMSRDDVEKLASRLWTKKTAEEPGLVVDSGVAYGGGSNWRSWSPDEKIRAGLKGK